MVLKKVRKRSSNSCVLWVFCHGCYVRGVYIHTGRKEAKMDGRDCCGGADEEGSVIGFLPVIPCRNA
jgi:hypothetical protein